MKKSVALHSALTSVVAGLFTALSATGQTAPTNPPAAATAEKEYQNGWHAEQAGDPQAAAAAYRRALEINPRHAASRYSLGQLKLTGGAIAAKGREMKFNEVAIPEFHVDRAGFREALDLLANLAEKQSAGKVTPNFVIEDAAGRLAATKITLSLKNIRAGAILKYLLDQTSAKARYDEHAIVIIAR